MFAQVKEEMAKLNTRIQFEIKMALVCDLNL